MIQALQLLMIDAGLGAGVGLAALRAHRRRYADDLEIPRPGRPENQIVSWTSAHRGGPGERGPFAVAEGSLWVDGKRIYHARDLGMRIVAGE